MICCEGAWKKWKPFLPNGGDKSNKHAVKPKNTKSQCFQLKIPIPIVWLAHICWSYTSIRKDPKTTPPDPHLPGSCYFTATPWRWRCLSQHLQKGCQVNPKEWWILTPLKPNHVRHTFLKVLVYTDIFPQLGLGVNLNSPTWISRKAFIQWRNLEKSRFKYGETREFNLANQTRLGILLYNS